MLDALYRAGRWAEADALATASLERRRSSIGTIYRDTASARLLTARGQGDLARERIAAGEQMAVGEIDADVGAYVALVGAEIAIDAGDPDAAIAAADRGLAHLEPGDDTVLVGPLCAAGLRAAADRAESARARRRPDDVAAAVEAGTRFRERATANWATTPPWTRSGHALAATCEAEWARLAGTADGEAWVAANATWETVPMPYPAAYAAYRLAEGRLIAGDRTGAEAALADAARAARRA